MRVAVECLQGTLFDWCLGMILIMKKQLYVCKRGSHTNIGYSSILVELFFERVPAIIPAVPLPSFSPSRLTKWGEVFLRQGGRGSVQRVYDDEFYVWWGRQLPTLEQFPYTGLEFEGYNDLVLPPRGMWGELGILLFIF